MSQGHLLNTLLEVSALICKVVWYAPDFCLQLRFPNRGKMAAGLTAIWQHREDLQRKLWQRTCHKLLRRPHLNGVLLHMRRRLDPWDLALLPGRRVDRALRLLQRLGTSAPPRVGAAAIRTTYNGWMNGRRMQKACPCILGCNAGDGSVKHSAYCKAFAEFRSSRLRLTIRSQHERLNAFICLDGPLSKESE